MKDLGVFAAERGYGKDDIFMFERARDFAFDILRDEKRLDGTSYFDRNLKVANYLIEAKMQSAVVVAGILCGVERVVSKNDIFSKFGDEISTLVFEQLVLKKIRDKSESVSADLMRRIFFSSLKDVRAVFVKLAMKLVSLESIDVFGEKEKKGIAKDAIEFYAPLAGRLGAENFKRKIEDVSFKIINPRKYSEIEKFLKEEGSERENYVNDLIEKFSKLLKGNFVKIKGRRKHIYSIYKKTVELKKPLRSQKDHLAIRVITKSKDDCYSCLGAIHENFEVIPGTLKDYISSPKENGYKSIHTVVKLEDGKVLEIQIRTVEMDEEAEEGAAAHWSYKKIKGDFGFEKKASWMKELVELRRDSSNEEFLKSLKLNLFDDKVYCYTPKGDAFDFPKGATILDFAYRIHGKIGDCATGGRINGNFVPLRTKLTSGDVVEIVTSKFQRPRRDWLKFVVTSKAKAYVRRGVKKFENLSIKSYSVVDKKEFDFEDLIYSDDFSNYRYNLARCCSPVPKDDIVGIVKSFKKVLVHKKNCSKIKDSTKSVIPVSWKKTFNRPIKIDIRVADRSGVLSDILNTVSRGGFVVREANIKLTDNNFAECFLIVIPKEIDEVERLVGMIQKIRGVMRISFE